MLSNITRLFYLACLISAPVFAQPQIGGGTCNSASVTGAYNGSVNAREITSQGTIAKAIQSIGSVTFDGQNNVTYSSTINLNVAAAVPVTYTGTYSVQANCVGVANLTSGGVLLTLSIVIYNGGHNLALSGQDGTYTYSGTASAKPPAGCTLATLTGPYVFTANGYPLAATSVNGIAEVSGAFQFDGKGKVTGSGLVNASGGLATVFNITGTYTLAASCLGTANWTDSGGITYQVALAALGATTPNLDLAAASPSLMYAGTAHSEQ